MTNSHIQKNKAFTLIELMVATSLFTIIMLMGIGSLIVSSDSAKAAQKLRIAVDNVNFAMESMTRELRTGTYFYCGGVMSPDYNNFNGDCPSGVPSDIITFIPQVLPGSPSRVGYYREVRSNSSTHTLRRCENSSSNCSDIVSSNVDVQSLKFFVKGSNITDKIQPSVQIQMSGIVKIKNTEIPFTLQSMASQRSSE
jgi:prepilin-type N-terminal cleavage/methylation domain-containing protein